MASLLRSLSIPLILCDTNKHSDMDNCMYKVACVDERDVSLMELFDAVVRVNQKYKRHLRPDVSITRCSDYNVSRIASVKTPSSDFGVFSSAFLILCTPLSLPFVGRGRVIYIRIDAEWHCLAFVLPLLFAFKHLYIYVVTE